MHGSDELAFDASIQSGASTPTWTEWKTPEPTPSRQKALGSWTEPFGERLAHGLEGLATECVAQTEPILGHTTQPSLRPVRGAEISHPD